jgi:hypothetical protein
MLEFRSDPENQYHNPAFQRDKRVVLYCGAALAGKTLQEMGYKSVFHAGGFKEMADAGWKRRRLSISKRLQPGVLHDT